MAITLGLVEAVDDNGVYVSMPGSKGVLRGPYATLQNVAAGDKVLVVTTDDGETVIVGLAAPESPRGTPASSTDNTVPRFDGTGGALQGSGVTIDDGGNIFSSGSVKVTKSSTAAITALSTGTEAYINVCGSNVWVRFRTTAEVDRFAIFAIGDELRVRRFDGSGGYLNDALTVYRTTGKVKLGDVGPTAGLEFGASGPTITTGTGAPSHSAPNGSVWLRTDGTASTTLYVRAAGSWSALS